MNWVEIVFILCVVAVIIISYAKGFAKMLITTCATLVAVLVVIFAGGPVKEALTKNTQIDEKLEEIVEEVLHGSIKTDVSIESEIDGIGLPDFLKDMLKDSVSAVSGTVQTQIEATSQSIVSIILTAVVDALLFILVYVILRCLSHALDIVTKLPLLHQLNGLAGAALGLVQMLLVLDIVFLIVAAFAHTGFGTMITDLIKESKTLSFLYEHNVVLFLVSRFIKL